ncbi:MAG: DUF2218 domain-containing protein [Phenylobacterium sp.]
MRSSSTIVTGNAPRYMSQLCKHFGHRVPTVLDEREGQITFEAGRVHLRASPATLMIRVESADSEGLVHLEGVVASHLKRFAFREPDLAVEWSRAPVEA